MSLAPHAARSRLQLLSFMQVFCLALNFKLETTLNLYSPSTHRIVSRGPKDHMNMRQNGLRLSHKTKKPPNARHAKRSRRAAHASLDASSCRELCFVQGNLYGPLTGGPVASFKGSEAWTHCFAKGATWFVGELGAHTGAQGPVGSTLHFLTYP